MTSDVCWIPRCLNAARMGRRSCWRPDCPEDNAPCDAHHQSMTTQDCPDCERISHTIEHGHSGHNVAWARRIKTWRSGIRVGARIVTFADGPGTITAGLDREDWVTVKFDSDHESFRIPLDQITEIM